MSTSPTDGLRREILSNGVTLLVQRRSAAPAATVATHMRAGFLDEPDALVGISHVLEHMLFKGTPSLGPGQLAERTKALGGSLNAYTSYDRTVYYASVPARSAVELIALQADQVQHPLLDAEELRRELGVIIQEARRKLDSPGAVAGETLHELLYATHRIRRWRIGTEAMLEKFTRDDVAGYHASRYVPSRTIVTLVGDIPEDDALAALRAEWEGWQRPVVPIPDGPAELSVPAVHARRMQGDVSLAEVALGWRAPGVLDAEIPALDMAAAILGVGRASRFGKLLREPGLVNDVGVSPYGVTDAGIFSIGIELDPARLPAALAVIGSTLHDLAVHAPAEAEFARALTMLRARVRRRLERFESRATALAEAESQGDVTRLDREEADLLAVTPEKVRDAVRKWLVPDGVSAVGYLPERSDAVFDEEMLQRGISGNVILSAAAAEPLRSRRTSVQSAGDRGPSTPALRAYAQDDRSIHHLALDGTDILTARFGETGQTSIGLYRRRTQGETSANAGIAALAVRAMLRGTVERDAAALAFAMESLGGTLSPSLGSDLLGFGTTVLREHVRAAAALLSEVLHQPRFAEESVEIERAILLEDARAVADDMMRFPVQLMLGLAFDDAGYGAPALGTAESVATFDADRLRAWHTGILAGDRTTIVAVGDADPARMADEIASVVTSAELSPRVQRGASGLSAARLPEALRFAQGDSAERTLSPGSRTERRDRKQSALAMLFPGPNRRDPRRFAAETWGAIAAGLGGRMFESLRSKRSLAYTVIASSWQRQRAGGLLTYIATDPARLDEARDAMLEELATFRREPPSADEMMRATAMLAGHAEMSPQTAGGRAGDIADAWLLGAGLAELDDPAAAYRAVTAEEVHAVTAASLDPALRAEGVVAGGGTE